MRITLILLLAAVYSVCVHTVLLLFLCVDAHWMIKPERKSLMLDVERQ